MTKDDQYILERLMDRYTITGLMDGLVAISHEKASHVIEAWQDERLARRWDALAGKFSRLAGSLDDPYKG